MHEEGKINENMKDKQELLTAMFAKIRKAYLKIKKLLDPDNDVRPSYIDNEKQQNLENIRLEEMSEVSENKDS